MTIYTANARHCLFVRIIMTSRGQHMAEFTTGLASYRGLCVDASFPPLATAYAGVGSGVYNLKTPSGLSRDLHSSRSQPVEPSVHLHPTPLLDDPSLCHRNDPLPTALPPRRGLARYPGPP